VVYLLRQACHSLAEAHAAGLVHRDVKPSNLFMCRYGRDLDFVKVLDFGLVTGHGPDGPLSGGDSQPEVLGGTPSFMAPEILNGEDDVDSRVDIYALGCVAYLLLTGKPVFDADSMVTAALHHLRDTPRPPSSYPGVDIDHELDDIVMRCLAKNPNERFSTAHELSDRLAQVPLCRPWHRERQVRWWQTYDLTTSMATSEIQPLVMDGGPTLWSDVAADPPADVYAGRAASSATAPPTYAPEVWWSWTTQTVMGL
jgi:serine/threonine-protein kinase